MAEGKLSREEKTVVALLGALGVIIILGSIFTGLYSFEFGLVTGISLWVLAGVIQIMRGSKKAILSLMGLAGLIVLLIGWLTEFYDFYLGLFAAIVIWILSGVVATYLGVK